MLCREVRSRVCWCPARARSSHGKLPVLGVASSTADCSVWSLVAKVSCGKVQAEDVEGGMISNEGALCI